VSEVAGLKKVLAISKVVELNSIMPLVFKINFVNV
jgi:hypothetical protein